MDNELQEHLERNEQMWKIWEERGVNSETELTVNFHFYAAKKDRMQLLVDELKAEEMVFRVKETRTLLFFKGWQIETDITQKWSLPLLQAKMGWMLVLARQTDVSLEGCGAVMPK
ncbi:ribonuclease E inhibitor RraB [Flavobacterium hercynium]|uniref:Regulator of ribonuclease activity B domain-containing protein n=1 Tax=Flavobacterium hercynium TaxID=387094 RepID=A0A226HRI9_9FLAO|nr:ribonuclease E inhibitor RraB [Flavobacterium hercynium]OXA96090.1 hypothetical protein B0A66_00475 [Flavobacterium hercynium]SMP06316.1 Regulator of ribonuclease activity B [Flavobacterium hercynium]